MLTDALSHRKYHSGANVEARLRGSGAIVYTALALVTPSLTI